MLSCVPTSSAGKPERASLSPPGRMGLESLSEARAAPRGRDRHPEQSLARTGRSVTGICYSRGGGTEGRLCPLTATRIPSKMRRGGARVQSRSWSRRHLGGWRRKAHRRTRARVTKKCRVTQRQVSGQEPKRHGPHGEAETQRTARSATGEVGGGDGRALGVPEALLSLPPQALWWPRAIGAQ